MTHPDARKASTTGSCTFNPDALFATWNATTLPIHEHDNLRDSIIQTFSLPPDDDFVYHAHMSVTLAQAQEAIDFGKIHGPPRWCPLENGVKPAPPLARDINAYVDAFCPAKLPAKALNGCVARAKQDSQLAKSAIYLISQRIIPDSIHISRAKDFVNPAYDYWAWSCRLLQWTGPIPVTDQGHASSHILPILMHHFGCAVPSLESMQIIQQISQGREVIDMGSGNGYWTFMLRKQGIRVTAIDSMQSTWRTVWIDDTVVEDSVQALRKRYGAKTAVLLLVYPIVGAEFTKKTIEAYRGNDIIVVGTQNHSGYTAFKDMRIDEWMAKYDSRWKKTVQVALPSFAGKDEALFVFTRKKP